MCGYALANPAFPHEATADQLFSESQFESYRSLGQFVANTILGVPGEPDMSAPTLELRPFWKHLCAYVAQYDNELPTG